MSVLLRRLLAGAALLAVCATGTSSSASAPDVQPNEVSRLPDTSHPSTVQGLRRLGTGSGFFISAERVLTNFHVVDNCRALTVGNNVEGL